MEQSTEEGYITKLMEKLHIDENPIQYAHPICLGDISCIG